MPTQICPRGVLNEQGLWLVLQRFPAHHKLLKEPLLEIFSFPRSRSPLLYPYMVPKLLQLAQHTGHTHIIRPSQYNFKPSSVPQ